jgi:hypothetical protein
VRTRWRTGTSVGRTIYLQVGETPSKQDTLIGLMDTAAMADLVVVAVNDWYARHGHEANAGQRDATSAPSSDGQAC